MRRLWAVGMLLAMAMVCGGGAAVAVTACWTPPDNTIVGITGTKDNGFTIEHYDGSREFPPTSSEARTECEEYHARVKEVRCKAEVRTWYRDLGATKRAIRYARAHPSAR
jgi:hypothetical protein